MSEYKQRILSKIRSARSPVALFNNGIGDHLMCIPTLRALAKFYDGRLSLACAPGVQVQFFRDIYFQNVFELDFWVEEGERLFNADLLARELSDCDALISLNPWHTGAVKRLLQLIGAMPSVGFFAQFDVVLPSQALHSIDLTFTIVQCIAPHQQIEEFTDPPFILDQAREAARKIKSSLHPSMRILAVHTETRQDKEWPTDRFVQLLDCFLEAHPGYVVWVIDFADRGINQGRHSDRIIPIYGTDLSLAFALIREANYFIGVDSCMLHAADFFRIPGVGLFGPTAADEFGFRFAPHRHVCEKSMNTICVEQALAALEFVTSSYQLS